jgi:hypothetical protein
MTEMELLTNPLPMRREKAVLELVRDHYLSPEARRQT